MNIKTILSIALILLFGACNAQVTRKNVTAISRLVNKLKNRVNQVRSTIEKIKKARDELRTTLDKEKSKLNEFMANTTRLITADRQLTRQIMRKRSAIYIKQRKIKTNQKIGSLFKAISKQYYTDKSMKEKENTAFKKEWNNATRVIRVKAQKGRSSQKMRISDFAQFVANIESQKGLENTFQGIGDELYLVSRQVQLQQFNEFEKARSDGNTGIKQIRSYQTGEKNYFSNDHSGTSVAGIFDKDYTKDKLGVGEFVAVMNGIEFRTKEDEYELKKPVRNDATLHKTEDVKYPPVPAKVLQEADVDQQIAEMRLWFKAFENQDPGVRDYKTHFKPLMSYVEGSWMTGEIDSDKSNVVQFTSQTGFSSTPTSHCPSKIMGFDDEKNPLYSKWHYRILSHQLEYDLPTDYLKFVHDTVSSRRNEQKSTKLSKTARFDLAGVDVNGNRRDPGKERPMYYTYLDALMEEIPGIDNYEASIMANGFDAQIKSAHPKRSGRNLNGANYHRPYKLSQKDAMGVDTAQRSYSDILYVALNKQTQISGPSITVAKKNIHIRASYALPFEIVYLTPLQQWNPFNIADVDDCQSVTGTGTKNDPYSASCPTRFYRTPQAFFLGGSTSTCQNDPDGHDSLYFQSGSGSPVCVVASGVRTLLPKINGSNTHIRQRYPIVAINGEGSSAWKKLNAMEDMVDLAGEIPVPMMTFSTGQSNHVKLPTHTHNIAITVQQYNALLNGEISSVRKPTEADDKHQHFLTLTMKDEGGKKVIYISNCDTAPFGSTNGEKVCFDSHWNTLSDTA